MSTTPWIDHAEQDDAELSASFAAGERGSHYLREKRLLCALFHDTLKSGSFNPVTLQGNDRCSWDDFINYHLLSV